MDPEKDVNVGRYLRFVVTFLLLMFGALGAYEYYYGAQARRANELQQNFQSASAPGNAAAATSSDAG